MNDINQKIAKLSAEQRALLKLKLNNKRKSNNTNNFKYQTISVGENHNNNPLSFAQQRLWFLNQLEPNNPFYNIPKAVRLRGDLKIQVLQQALDTIVSHHQILHTNYVAENGKPRQINAAPQSVELKIIDLQQHGQAEDSQIEKLLQQESQRPFDLRTDTMLRGCLLQVAQQEYVMLLVVHHIAADGWSMDILWKQLTQLYQAFLEGKPNPIKMPTIQYADYALWQREWLSGEVLDKQLNYWKHQLADANPILELPTDRPRPAVQTYRGAKQLAVIPQRLRDGLRKLCGQEGVTLYMTLLTAFKALLYRYSRQEDIIVGSPIAGRNRAEIEESIGFFVNTLALRTSFSDNPSFQELLQRVQQTILDSYSHQDLPFEKIVEELNPERSLSHSPIFQVMFDLENASGQTEQLLGLTQTPLPVETKTAKFDLTLSVIDTDEELIGIWEYNTDLFDAPTIERMTGHFQTLLEGIVANPQQSIAQLPLLTTSEQQQLIVQKNIEIRHRQKCIPELFEEQVEKTPNAIAVEHAGEQLTYAQLNTRANQLAHYLRTLGVEADQLVGISVERSLEMVVGLLGILKAGGAYVPLDPAYPPERLSYMISDADISVLVTQTKWDSQLPKHQAQIICLDSDWQKITFCSPENPNVQNKAENLAYVIYTSGSTGKPKGVMISHQALSNFTQTAIAEYGITDSDRLLQFASINFDAAVEEIYPCLSRGATLVLRTEAMLADLKTFFRFCEDLSLTVLDLPTAYWHQLATELSSRRIPVPQSLRLVIIGGEKVLPELVMSWQEHVIEFGKSNRLQLINTYGPTETTVSATAYSVPCNISSNIGEIPIGRPLAHLQTYILDQYQQVVPIGVRGELHIGGESLAKGYLNRPELTAEKFISHPFNQESEARLYKTGDLARYLPDGNIEFIGRIDNQVKIRGFRIELGEIESVLAQHPDIRETVVIAREDIPGDKRLVAYIISQQEQPHSNDLRSFLKELLPNYMVPSIFVFLDTIPLTPNGKVDRRALPIPSNTRQEPSSTFVSPQDELEFHLTKIWSQVLGIEPIGIRDNFFDLGGNSLQAVVLFAQIEKQFGKSLPLATLFQSATIAEIAQIIRSQEWLAPWSSLVPIQPNGNKPPLFYIHAGGGNLLIYRDSALALGSDQPVYGLQPRGLDGRYMPFNRIEDMAAHYLAQIRKLQPDGPYFLAGLSSGGNIAWEIAQLLQAQGQEVALLALFDANGTNYFKLLPPIPRLLSVFNRVVFDFLRRWVHLPLQIILELKQSGTKQTSIKILEASRIVRKVLNEDQNINQQKMQKIFEVRMAKYKSISGNINLLERWVNSIAIFFLKLSSRPSLVNTFVQAIVNDVRSEDSINNTNEIP
ncbi:MAG: amino acid adenylation domain-containing protein, partial [Cyanobacteria bacterium P01_A01_bin.83]